MKVHLEGFGLVGTMVAWHLYSKNVPFTWSDTHEHVRAWEASSGLIYPSGDPTDELAYRVWERWHKGAAPWSHEPTMRLVTEEGAFWYASKNAPNGSTAPAKADIGILRLSSLPSYHLDVARFVLQTRRLFRSNERTYVPAGSVKIVAHGFNKRLHHYVWGWTADVALALDQRLVLLSEGRRPCFYLRIGRFNFGYANPRPGSAMTWIAGSSHLPQPQPKSYEIDGKFDRWLEFFRENTGGLVKVRQLSDAIDGWRPAPAEDDADALGFTRDDGVLYAPPLGGNGVRYAPYYCLDVLSSLQLVASAGSAAHA